MAGVALVFAAGPAAPASAQQNGGIAGVVRDTGGLAMPGVVVEAASPALIEKVRSAVSDGEGRYNIVDLRPGTYSVTFSLAGFSTVRREGIELSAGFVAPVNVNLSVGAISETITVTGASPVVDTQSIRQQEVLNTRQLENLPSGSIGLQTLAYVTPGFASTQADVGGTRDTWSAQGAYTFFHGKTGTRASFDGFRNQYFIGAGNGVGYISDSGTIQELQLETSGMGAESGSGSTSLNAIPKSGGNLFRGGIDGFFSGKGMQGSNIDDDLRAFGINSSAEVQKIYRLGAQLGGPIMKDKIWFFAAVARWGSRVNQPGAYYNALQGKSGIPGTPHHRLRARPRSSRRQLRLVPQPFVARHLAGHREAQVRLVRRPPEVVPLHHRPVHRCQRDRVRARLGLVAVGRRAGHVAGAADQQAAGRSGRFMAGRQLGQLRAGRRDPRRPLDPRDLDQLPLRCDLGAHRAHRPHRPQRAARHGVVRHRQPQLQGRGHARAGLQRRVALAQQRNRRAELRLPERPAVAPAVSGGARTSSRNGRTPNSASSCRTPGPSSASPSISASAWTTCRWASRRPTSPPVRTCRRGTWRS